MLKKVLIAVVVLMLAAVAYVKLMPKPAPKPAPAPVQAKHPVTKPWDGTESRTYNLSFVRAGQVMTLDSISYSGLDTAKTTATVVWETDKGATATMPKWLSPSRFWARSVTGNTWPAFGKAVDLGTKYRMTLTFVGLPTLQIGQSEVGMIVKSPDGLFSVGFNPPDPPPGHSLAEKVAQEDRLIAADHTKPVVHMAGRRVARRHVRLLFRGSDETRLQRLLVIIDGKRHFVAAHGTTASYAVSFRRGRHLVKAQARDANGNLSAVVVARVRVIAKKK